MSPYIGIALVVLFVALMLLSSQKLWRVINGLGFTFAVLATGVAALTFPSFFIQWGEFELKNLIVPLVQLTLFGMGMTLTVDDFLRVLQMPKAVLIGVALQFLIMPFSGFLCARMFGLQGDVAAGLILIGSCPGGVTSNVITYLARGDVPLSVTMTACSTLLSPLMTPLAMYLLAGTYVPIAVLPMIVSIIKMIIIPLVAGVLVYRFLPRLAAMLSIVLPLLAMASICTIIGITVALSCDDLLHVGLALLAASIMHNALGYTLGYYAARLAGLGKHECRTVAIEVGIQNGGMATGLAFSVLKSSQSALAAATFGPWSAISSSVLASWWSKCVNEEREVL